jgi:GT2 family glycosyltransferase
VERTTIGKEAVKKGPEFTIIIPVCHDKQFLRKALASLRQIDFPADCFEVIVAGTNNAEDLGNVFEYELDKKDFSFTYIGCSVNKRSNKLNAACRAARGRILAFTDDDCVFPGNWLKKLQKVFETEGNIGIVGGRDELEHVGSMYDISLDIVLNSFFATGGLRTGLKTSLGKYYPKLWNMAVPRDVAMEGTASFDKGNSMVFNESLNVHEDVDLADRIEKSGKRIIFAPEWYIGHYRDTTFLSFFLRNIDMGSVSRGIGIHRLPHGVLAAFAVGTPLLILCAFFFDFLRMPLFILLGVYGSILLVTAVKGFLKTKILTVLFIVPVLTASLHIARGIGFLFSRHRQKDTLY